MAPHFGAIIFAMHANPHVIGVSSHLDFKAEDFRGLKLNKNLLIFTGCDVGNESLRKPGKDSLMEVVMTTTNARGVVGKKIRAQHAVATIDFGQSSEGEALANLMDKESYTNYDFEDAAWYILLSGGSYLGGGYLPFWEMLPLDLGNGQLFHMPELPHPDPISQWRVLERVSH